MLSCVINYGVVLLRWVWLRGRGGKCREGTQQVKEYELALGRRPGTMSVKELGFGEYPPQVRNDAHPFR